MNMTVVIYALMAVLAMLILASGCVFALSLKWPQPAQTGDCTLGPRSVNWLAAIAISAAVWICLA